MSLYYIEIKKPNGMKNYYGVKNTEVFPSKGKVDEALIGAGSKLGQLDSRRMMDTMKVLIDAKDSCVRPFVDNIEMVNQLYNKPINVLLDGKNIYLGVA